MNTSSFVFISHSLVHGFVECGSQTCRNIKECKFIIMRNTIKSWPVLLFPIRIEVHYRLTHRKTNTKVNLASSFGLPVPLFLHGQS